MSFYRGVLLSGTGSVITITMLFAETALAVRVLTAENYGIFVLLVAITNFVVMGMDFGCKIAVIQQIASSDTQKQIQIVNSVVLFRLFVCIFASAILWYSHDALRWLDPTGMLMSYVAWLPVMFIFTSLDQLFEAMLKGFKRYQHVAIAQTGRSILRFGLTVLFVVGFQLGPQGIIFSWIFSFAFSSMYQYALLPVPKRLKMDRSLLNGILRFGVPIQATAFLWHVSGQIQVVLLSALAGPSSVAIFDVAAKIPMALQRISESFISVYFPTMSTLLSNKNYDEAGRVLAQSLKLTSFVVAAGVLMGIAFSREAMVILFSAEYRVAAFAFSLMLLSFHMMFVVNLFGYTLTSAGFPKLSLVENSVRALTSIAATLILVPIYNFNGAASSRLLSNYAAWPVVVWLLQKKNIPVYVRSFLRQSGLLWMASIVLWLTINSDLPAASSVISRLSVIVGFIAVNLFTSTVSLQDLFSLVPGSIRKRFGLRAVALRDVG